MKKLTKEEFVRRANKIHNGKYDYSKSVYVNFNTKLCIVCPKHGEFWQTPGNHLKGKQCPVCSGKEMYDNDSFILKAKEIWGDRFDYSKVIYKKSLEKVCIIDKDGKEYWQTPSNHISGFDPSVNKLMNKDKFIEIAKIKHNNKYDYSLVDYKKGIDRVKIICPKHGIFYHTIYKHLNGYGCPKCSSILLHNEQRKTLKDFLKKAKEIHGDKYNYSKVNYKNNHTKVCIICSEHGEFFQTPYTHLKGCGCPICSGRIKSNTEEFVKKAKEVHGEKYDYSKVNYVNNHTKVCIICPKHGNFRQIPSNHLKGQGCPVCGKNNIQENKLYDYIKTNLNTIEIIHSYWKNHLEYDIFIPKYKIAIEVQGAQHFKPIDFGGKGIEHSNTEFIKEKKRDLKKYNMAKNDGIIMLYFSNLKEYNVFNGEKIYHNSIDLLNKIKELINEYRTKI